MAKKKWSDKLVIKAYEYAYAGLRNGQIARTFGISKNRFADWKKLHPLFAYALKRARKKRDKENGESMSFRDYVYQQLPDNIQKVWDEVTELDEAESGQAAIEALLSQHGKRVRQNIFVHAMVSSNFSLSQSLKRANISKATLDYWKKNEPEFAVLIEELNWHKKNFFEDHLATLVAGGDSAATIFANRSFNADRGYGDKQRVDVNVNAQIETSTPLSLEELDLPPELLKQILDHIRHKKIIESKVVTEKKKLLEAGAA